MFSFNFKISPAHACLEGHFPGNTVVPGVIIIDEVMRGILTMDASIKIDKISAIKFMKPLQPGISVQVNVTKKSASGLGFTCTIDELLIVSGQFLIQEAVDL